MSVVSRIQTLKGTDHNFYPVYHGIWGTLGARYMPLIWGKWYAGLLPCAADAAPPQSIHIAKYRAPELRTTINDKKAGG
jgi:hypothetical protein